MPATHAPGKTVIEATLDECPRCNGADFQKFGFDRGGHRVWKCLACGKRTATGKRSVNNGDRPSWPCPKCRAFDFEQSGSYKGKKKWRCRNCQTRKTDNGSSRPHGIAPDRSLRKAARLAAEGLSAYAISKQVNLSPKTISVHLNNGLAADRCVHCESLNTVRWGYTGLGHAIVLCKDCGRQKADNGAQPRFRRPDHIRMRAIHLAEQGYGVTTIARIVTASSATVYRWVTHTKRGESSPILRSCQFKGCNTKWAAGTNWKWCKEHETVWRNPPTRRKEVLPPPETLWRSSEEDGAGLMRQVDSVIPAYVTGERREDLRNDLIILVLSGEVPIAEIADHLKEVGRKYNVRFTERSLDAPLSEGDEGGASIGTLRTGSHLEDNLCTRCEASADTDWEGMCHPCYMEIVNFAEYQRKREDTDHREQRVRAEYRKPRKNVEDPQLNEMLASGTRKHHQARERAPDDFDLAEHGSTRVAKRAVRRGVKQALRRKYGKRWRAVAQQEERHGKVA